MEFLVRFGARTPSARSSLDLPLRVSWQFNRLSFDGQISYEHLFGRDDDAISAGVRGEYAVSPRWSMGFELIADAPPAQWRAYDFHCDIGAGRKPGKHFKVEALVDRSVDNRRGPAATLLRMEFKYLP